ncbi:hypothetical protein [Candidatus Bathycorpusculum sp.]|uniref:hypothetical protein n=1 Tax=Candidatus Bathycorpusculum sp. TaxID=2994959 RepID=UPI0028284971|nr:hypothetical protein [Candidatus Termitimicrobium sp.]MCL2430981.1 hypothetical protein [Candidatus Termitimicrobium sp.]
MVNFLVSVAWEQANIVEPLLFFMGYQPRIKSPRNTIRQHKKYLREKDKTKRGSHRRYSRQDADAKPIVTAAEFAEITLKRLHTLGAQKFGSSPFSEHFNRWIANVEVVLDEFEVYYSVCVDEQFRGECVEALNIVRSQLEERRQKEAIAEQETKNLHYCRNLLKQINIEYAVAINALKTQKKNEIKRLNSIIDQLKNDQDKIIRIKTGFWRGISKKEREQKELVVIDALNEKQTELELVVLNFKEQQKTLREQFEHKREPIQKQMQIFQKKVQAAEIDCSLEERWFACETLTDALNGLLQRKAVDTMDSRKLEPKNDGI